MKTFRKIAALLAVLACLCAAGFYFYWRQGPQPVAAMELNDSLRQALTMKQEQSGSAFQLALVIVGVLWATLMAQKDEKSFEVTDWPPVVMFLSSNVAMITSMLFHTDYLERTTNELWARLVLHQSQFPDILNSTINNAYFGQRVFLIAGMLCTMLHLLVVYRLTPGSANIKSQTPTSP